MSSSDASYSPAAQDLSAYDNLLRRSTAEAKIRPSASVIPWRFDAQGEIEIWWARRALSMRFMPGFWAFPGGALAPSDAEVPVAGRPQGVDDATLTRASPELDEAGMRALGPDLAQGVVCGALRELFEEIGLLVLEGGATPPSDALRADRVRLLRGEITFADVVRRHGRVDAGRLVFAGRWLTPPFAPLRYDNRFFLLHWPQDLETQPVRVDELRVDGPAEGLRSEHDRGKWIRPAAALDRWNRCKLLASPPILHVLRVLADEGSPSERALERLHDTREADLGPLRKIEFIPGIVLLPMRTPTLPPATHTNTFLLGYPNSEAVLIDPGTPLPEEQERLLAALDAAQEQGYDIGSIWLSHHHPDHIAAAQAVSRHLGGALICAHLCDFAALRRRGIYLQDELEDRQVVRFDGEQSTEVKIYHTPGHTPGHLCFYLPKSRTLLACDLTSTLSTIVIDPPDGDMNQYLASLRRMIDLDPAFLFPSHGPGHSLPTQHLQEILDHRLEREEEILAAWRDGLTSAEAIVTRLYAELPPDVVPVAVRQTEAHLIRLRYSDRLD